LSAIVLRAASSSVAVVREEHGLQWRVLVDLLDGGLAERISGSDRLMEEYRRLRGISEAGVGRRGAGVVAPETDWAPALAAVSSLHRQSP
jgi:hypothetical protein